jgi:protease I
MRLAARAADEQRGPLEDMMSKRLTGRKIAILADDGFEQSELTSPKKALEEAGAEACIVSPAKSTVKSWDHTDWGRVLDVDVPLSAARVEDYDGLVLPGGVMNPDRLRMNTDAVSFVKAFFDANKPVGAICHGPWTLVNAGAVEGRTMTSWPSIRADLENAGAHWVDEPVVTDRGLVTSRCPDDLPAFNAGLIDAFAAGSPAR